MPVPRGLRRDLAVWGAVCITWLLFVYVTGFGEWALTEAPWIGVGLWILAGIGFGRLYLAWRRP